MVMKHDPELGKYAKALDLALQEGRAITRFTKASPGFSIDDGYAVQDMGMALRIRRGERVVGWKMGMTSRPKMLQMGVNSPIYGMLTDAMQFSDAGFMSLRGKIHPRIEPEVAFIISKDLEGNISPAQALQGCSGVCAALEVIDSRYENFDFQLPDVVADNCSASGVILGNIVKRTTEKFDISNLGMILEVNHKAVQFGSTAAILGHPARSLAELVKMLTAKGQLLKAGSIVLAGGATAAVPFTPGDTVRVSIQNLGSATITATKEN